MRARSVLALVAGALVIVAGVAYARPASPTVAQAIPGVPGLNAPQMESTHFGLNWHVVGSGGGPIDSSHFRLNATLGQAAIGSTESTHFVDRAGYWQDFGAGGQLIYLPLVVRQS